MGIVSAALFISLYLWPMWWVLVLGVIIFGIALFAVAPLASKEEERTALYALGGATAIANILLMMVADQPYMQRAIIPLAVVMESGIFSWFSAAGASGSFERKSLRRFMVSCWSWNVFAVLAALFAFDVFFLGAFWSLPLLLIGSGVCAWVCIQIWQYYYAVKASQLTMWGVVVGVVMFELIWSIHLLPLDYMALGFLSAWIWYVLQLFVRFHLSGKGIDWKKQLVFLGANAVLFAFFLIYFVRWV